MSYRYIEQGYKWLILFFYPLDFGYVSPSELMELEKRRPQLELLNCR